MQGEALVVLVGITAGRRARSQVYHFLSRHSDYDVFVPPLPYRCGIQACAGWLQCYLEGEVRPKRYRAVHAIAYIAGGLLLRCLHRKDVPVFERIVYFRSPVQERVAGTLVRRVGRTLAGWLGGRATLDLADGWPAELPMPQFSQQQGLVIEMGRSRLARLLGLTVADIPAAEWAPERLLPGAEDALYIPESHDDVYTSERVLAAALHFIREGRFPPPLPAG